MLDPHLFGTVRLPSAALMALDSSGFHAVVQPWHYLLRALHILSAAAFFGGIILLDLRLIGVRSAVELKALSADVMPCLYIVFGIAIATGIPLFLYDPVSVASRAFFVPKIVLIVAGVVNAALYNRFAYEHALTAQAGTPFSAKWAGALSITFWVCVMLFSSMNLEGVPKTPVAITHGLNRAKVTQFDDAAHRRPPGGLAPSLNTCDAAQGLMACGGGE